MNCIFFLSAFLSIAILVDVNHKVDSKKKISITPCYEDTTKFKTESDSFMCYHNCNIIEATIDAAKWKRYLETQMAITYGASKDTFPAGCHTIMVKFMIDVDGSIKDVTATSFDNPELAKIAVGVISKGPNWQPEKQSGKPARSYRTQPVTFLLEDEPEIEKKPVCDTVTNDLISL